MEIFTSYYNKAKALSPDRWEFVQISNSKPSWWEYPTTKLDALVPPWHIVSAYKYHGMSWAEYTEQYMYHIQNCEAEDAIGTIEKLAEKKNVVLLCHEPPDRECHRHLLSFYMRKKLGIDVKELILK